MDKLNLIEKLSVEIDINRRVSTYSTCNIVKCGPESQLFFRVEEVSDANFLTPNNIRDALPHLEASGVKKMSWGNTYDVQVKIAFLSRGTRCNIRRYWENGMRVGVSLAENQSASIRAKHGWPLHEFYIPPHSYRFMF